MAESGHTAEHLSSTVLGGSDILFEFYCDLCEREGVHVDAHGYCCDCKEYLCIECYRVHLKPTPMRHHALLDKYHMSINQQQNHGNNTCTETCPEHKNKIVEYFCTTHDQLGCDVCMTIIHRNCEGVGYIPEVATIMMNSQEYEEVQHKLVTLTQTAKQSKKTMHDQVKVSEAYHSNALQAMEQFRKDIKKALDILEHKILEEADASKAADMKKIYSVETKFNHILQELQALESKLSSHENNHQYCQLFIDVKRARSELKTLEASLCGTDNDIEVKSYRFQPMTQALELLNSPENMAVLEEIVDQPMITAVFRHIWIPIQVKDQASKHLVTSADNAAMETRDPRKTKAHRMEDISVKSRCDIYSPSVTNLVLLHSDKLVIVDHKNNKVKLIHPIQRTIVSELECSAYISDLARINSDQVAVVFPTEKKIMTLNVDSHVTFDREIKVNENCAGIACLDGTLIVTYASPAKVQILDIDGKVLQTVVTKQRGLLETPTYVAASANKQTIYVSDSGNHTVTSLGMDGKVKAIYSDSSLKRPRKIATTATGAVYVCGTDSNNIHQLTADCTKVQILLTQSDGLTKPYVCMLL